MRTHPLEKPYLKERLDTISKMMDTCFNAEVLDSEANVVKVLLTDKTLLLNMPKDVSRAFCFKDRALKTCVEHDFLPHSATLQVETSCLSLLNCFVCFHHCNRVIW